METIHAAFGLRLASPLPFPGLPASTRTAEGLPQLKLNLADPIQLESAWSGTSGPWEWRGRLGDGLDLTIERGMAGDTLFAYGNRARFLLHPDMCQLDCAPETENAGLDWQRALLTKVIPTVSVMRGYEALHAASVDSPEGVLVIMAPSGTGKSTLVIEFLQRGWPLFADDVLILESLDDAVLAHPGTPHMNVAEDEADELNRSVPGETLGMLAGERWLAAETTTTTVRPIRMLCLLERGRGLTTQALALTPSPLPLAPYMLGLFSDTERERRRFSLYADLTQSTPLVRVTADLEQTPGRIANLLEDALAGPPEPSARGVA
jgi:hypothetical protein